ncbi:MAG TPA: gamma-glutamyl-gamma-aminobutyrate hydrolase family protein, partial [Candidatus Sulfotelmatobacter sp.]|nr:gamma-glutamyl-gamma-aminobutyrate hydrolase family protein [Candidatus Sulfotelmatobacter sp.]
AAPGPDAPRIVLTVQAPEVAPSAAVARRKNGRYVEALEARGARAIALDERTDAATRTAALRSMDGLLLTGGADVGPERYGEPVRDAVDVEPGRDTLEAEAFAAARARGVPILGVCRGLQYLNVLMGGRLVQHVDDHGSPSYGTGPANQHPITVLAGSRLASILQPGAADDFELAVNTYHHQAVRPADLAAGLRASAFGESSLGPLVEGLETADEPFFVAVQCHPERTESTPAAFDRLWDAFVAACRRPAAVTPGAGRPR